MNRIQAFAAHLEQSEVEAFFAQTPISMGYLAGFWEDGHERFLTLAIHKSGQYRLICPALSEIQARRMGIEDIRSWKDGEDPVEHFAQLCDDWDLHSAVVAVDDFMPSKMLIEMQSVLYAALFKPGSPILAGLMARKDDAEIELMKRAGQIADETYLAALGHVREGISEIELQEFIEQTMRSKGGVPQFCSVCFGANAAESHHLNDQTKLVADTPVLLDFGCTFEGYCSDITRVFSFGKASELTKKLYGIVYGAHMAAKETVAIGVAPSLVDKAARDVIEEHGYGANFTHRTGHGIGLQVHENPYISAANHEPLVAGNCFSIEPGIYLEGMGGVRLENLYFASESGAVSFNAEIAPEILEL